MIVFNHDEVLQRLLATKAVQEAIAVQWVWEEKPVVGWVATVTTLTQTKVTVDQGEAALALAEGALSSSKDTLHAKTKQIVGLAKLRFRKDPVKSQAFVGLRALGTTATTTLRSADDLAAAWAKADATGSYVGTSLADYNALRTSLATAQAGLESARATLRQAKKHQQSVLKDTHGDLVAWYGAATRVFDTNTETGALVRAQIPT